MNVLTIPRAAAALEYKALRYPAQLFENHVVASLFAQESSVRLAFERLLGTLDSTAGALFADQALADRGRALTRRAEVVEKAATLEVKAQQGKERAEAERRTDTEKIRNERLQAARASGETAQQLRAQEQAEKAAVAQEAHAREEAAEQAIADKASSKVTAERDRLDQQQARIDAQADTRTAGAKAQLSTAVEDTQAAQQQKADADRLASRAAAEKASRGA